MEAKVWMRGHRGRFRRGGWRSTGEWKTPTVDTNHIWWNTKQDCRVISRKLKHLAHRNHLMHDREGTVNELTLWIARDLIEQTLYKSKEEAGFSKNIGRCARNCVLKRENKALWDVTLPTYRTRLFVYHCCTSSLLTAVTLQSILSSHFLETGPALETS